MKKSFKKAIAVILTVLMVLTSVPFTALAAPGDYSPNFKLQFNSCSTYGYDELIAGEGAYEYNANQAYVTGYMGLYGAPLDYDIKTGELSFSAAKGEAYKTFNEASEPLSDYNYTVGDYFTVTVLLENIKELAVSTVAIKYSDNIEPAGIYQYGQKKNIVYGFAGISDLNHPTLGAPKATISAAGSPVDGHCADDFYEINTVVDTTEWHDTRIDPNDEKLGASGTNGVNYIYDVGVSTYDQADVSSTPSDPNNPFFSPVDGSEGYNYVDTAILHTYMFKITGDGPITFDLLDKNNSFIPGYGGARYLARTDDGTDPKDYTTYAINTYVSPGDFSGPENPGSAKITWFGTNENKSTPTPTHTHNYSAVVTAPTCTEQGYTTYTCDNADGLCDNPTYTADYTPATGHSLTKTDAVAPTCTTAGNIEYYTCANCHKLFSDAAGNNEITSADTVDPATGHNLTKTDAVAATCGADGNIEYYTCSACGKIFSDAAGTTEITREDTVLTATGAHTYGDWVSDGNRNHSKTCSVCGDVVTEACSDFSYSVVTPATYDKEGTGRYTCKACGYYYDVTIPVQTCAHANTTIINAEEATCTKEGYTGDTYCNDCGKTIATGTTIPMAAHTLTKTDAVAATCTTNGNIEYYTCSVCNKIFSDAAGTREITLAETVLAAPGHSLTKTDAVAATCTTNGNIEYYTCSVCKKIFSDAAGTREITREETVIAAPGHSLTKTDAVAATCTTNGNIEYYTCSACGKIFSDAAGKNEITREETVIAAPGTHTNGAPVEEHVVPATVDAPGSKDVVVYCSVCGEEISRDTVVLPIIPSYTVTVEATDKGHTTINDVDSTSGKTVRIAKEGGKVTLTAAPVDGAEFVGWMANGETLVSTEATFSPAVLANVVYTPVFALNDTSFTVTFVDAYGNVVDTQTVTSGADIEPPAGPARAGYTFTGWSLTNEEIAILATATTVTAVYEKDAAKTYTVTATGCTITVNGADNADVATGIDYDTRVTVTASGAKAWKVGDVVAAYGESYSFYVGADITVTPVFEDAVATAPAVANVKVEEYGTTGAIQARFLATRSMEGFKCVDFGFVYGKGDLGEVTLDDVTGTTVKAVYCKTNANQFSLTYGLRAQTGTVTARAFVAYVDGNGDTQVVYADPMTYRYA